MSIIKYKVHRSRRCCGRMKGCKVSEFSKKLKKAGNGFCTAVVTAAGSSSRMGQDKLMLELDGRSVLEMTLRAVSASESVDEIILAVRADMIEAASKMCADAGLTKVKKVVCGGKTRAQSSLAGASEASRRADIIIIHDGARPFVTAEVIDEAVRAAALYRAAAPAMPVKDTVRLARDNVAFETPERALLFAVQTPQAFDADLIKGALTYAVQNELPVTDDCACAEAMGVRIHLTRGDEENIKLTTPADLVLARAITERRAGREK